jgi:hypothetical protein
LTGYLFDCQENFLPLSRPDAYNFSFIEASIW